jgi:hypothetical protein
MLSFIHPKLQIKEFLIQFVIKSKKGFLLVKKNINQKAKPLTSTKDVKIFGIIFAMPSRNYNAQIINLRYLTPYYTKEGSQNGDGGH